MREWLSNKEKSILFSALTREKRVCIEVDKQLKQNGQSLQSVCESLEYKFYYDRLFKKIEKQIREAAIDDFVKTVKKHDWNIGNRNENEFIYGAIDRLAEMLKEDK